MFILLVVSYFVYKQARPKLRSCRSFDLKEDDQNDLSKNIYEIIRENGMKRNEPMNLSSQ